MSNVSLPSHKTKIVCTIGPASNSPAVMEQMIRAGMNIARLNFSHGNFESHRSVIQNLRAAAGATGRRISIMADLPGPKMRVGEIQEEPVDLKAGDQLTLTSDDITGDPSRISVSFKRLPDVLKPGNKLFLNDGIIQLQVDEIKGHDVRSHVVVGGELRSRKGLNVPGIDLGIQAFTEQDHKILKFALENGVDAISQSFVESADDIEAVRSAAYSLGHTPFIIAKIERSRALENIDSILTAAHGIMIARGDLGVEIPIEEIALTQKRLMRKANLQGKPVITATQMLESMTTSRLPTRAEATDVANAIIDGTDCVMLSGESAMGKFPVDAVSMLARIAASTEPQLPRRDVREAIRSFGRGIEARPADLISLSLESMLEHITPEIIVVPTKSGATARNIARFKFPVWIAAVSRELVTCQHLQFSYGAFPVHEPEMPDDWNLYTRNRLQQRGVAPTGTAILIEGPSHRHPEANHRIEILDLSK
jgi:pyruvate kinase